MSNRTPEQQFAVLVRNTALKQMSELLGSEKGQKAAQAVTMAFLAAMKSSKDPGAFLRADPSSIAACVAMSAQTDLFPGGPNPVVYLVPQSGEIQWRITHRGLCVLAARAGYNVMAVPVGSSDHIVVGFGEATEHRADPANHVDSLEDLVGVIVVVRRNGDGDVLTRAWVPRAVIEKRRGVSRMSNKGPWKDWPVEMAQKTAILYTAARGSLPVDTSAIRAAIEAEHKADQIVVQPAGASGMAALGLAPERPALSADDIVDEMVGTDDDRETVTVPAEAEDADPAQTSAPY